MAKCRINLYDICHTLELGLYLKAVSMIHLINRDRQIWAGGAHLITCMQKQTNSAPSVPPTLKFCP